MICLQELHTPLWAQQSPWAFHTIAGMLLQPLMVPHGCISCAEYGAAYKHAPL